MSQFDLRAVDGHGPANLDSFEANDMDEAIALSMIRLERRDMELRSDGAVVARFTKEGQLTRLL